MAIQITRELKASPTPTTLPRRISFTHEMVSDRSQEVVTVTYRIDAQATAIRFLDADGRPVSEVVRTETVTSTPQEYEDRMSMTGAPRGAFENVEIVQTVVDAAGEAIPGLAVLTVQR